ncbi:MAG: succinylglutamate desuccinylase/aspartoacylase family protein [Ruminococcus sp.]|jgi:predicted deacylase|nr:succinylglutamate desuccinylase/aspartoacylase family protein [Ruminococcus sp.]
MIETVAQVELPVGERLLIQKNRFEGDKSCRKRISIITGTHGDELEGQYVIWKLCQKLSDHPERIKGTIDLYPALNPLGINIISRVTPLCELDLNRMFPGNKNGDVYEYLAAEIVEDISDPEFDNYAVDIHASNIYLRELPQVRINEQHETELLPLATVLNMPFIWVHSSATVLESTLAYSLNSRGCKTLVVEMGVGMRLTQNYGDMLVDGILTLMKDLGIWEAPPTPPKLPRYSPIVSRDKDNDLQVYFVNAPKTGLFIPEVSHTDNIKQGERLGIIADPLTGESIEILSPCRGLLFTLREYPVVLEGSLIARIYGAKKQ